MGFGVAHVYRSVNGGATWSNISANLPNSPANSVVVDPNNPLTVYVAMDTGVYVAADVTTCVPASGTGSCWGVLGTALPNAPVMSLVATAGVTLPGSSSAGALRAATYGRGIWQIGLVSSAQTLAPVATFVPAWLNFGSQDLGSTSTPQTITLTNTGNTVLAVGTILAGTGFAETDTCSNAELTVGATCSLAVTFSPLAAGAATGTLQIDSNVSSGSSTVDLSGTGLGVPNILLTPTTITFADTAVNSTSQTMAVTVSNTGTGDATLSAPAVTADFNIAGSTCTSTLAAGGTCRLLVNFQPTGNTARSGTLTVTDSTANHTAMLFGTGTGTAVITFVPATLSFGVGEISTRTSLASVTITNSGTALAVLSSPVVSGSDFSVYTNTCSTYLQPNSNCVVTLLFSPAGTGPRAGTLSFSDENGTHVVTLTGTATAAPSLTASPATLTFATTPVYGTSASQIITVTNIGGNTYLGTEQVTGDFGITANTCGVALNTNQSCLLTVVFGPITTGVRSGAVTVTDRAGVAHTVLLTGNGNGAAAVSVSATSLLFAPTGVGSTSSPQTITITNTGTAATALSPSAITGDFSVVTNTCGNSLAAGVTCALSVTFTPTDSGARSGTLT